MNNKHKYKFSVIIPVYNVEDYLEETIKSLINQSIGFKENIQLILVNDGSFDKSSDICLKYRDLYPNNIVYIEKENGGVSSARNKGLEFTKGEFINFLDSDDLWDNKSFEEVYKAYKRHPDISLFSCKMCFFDAKKGNHPLNYKYRIDKIINILTDFTFPQLSSSSIFIRKDAIEGHFYDETIKYSEDNKFINEIIFEQQKYMVLSKPIYYYRRRFSKTSAIQSQTQSEDWFNVTPKKVYEYLFKLSEKKFGKAIEYIQYLVSYELNWRINIPAKNVLDEKQEKSYLKIIKKLLNYIDDEIILSTKNSNFAKKSFLLSYKYSKKIDELIKISKNTMFINNNKIDVNELEFVTIDRTYFKDDHIYLYGKLDTKYISRDKLKVMTDNHKINVDYYELTNDDNEPTFNGKLLHHYIGIHICTNLFSGRKNLMFKYKNITLPIVFKRSNLFFERLPNSYRRYRRKLITYDKKTRALIFDKGSIFKRCKYELRNDIYLIKNNKYKVALIRLFICVLSVFKRKKIMLISDRINKADDNGEHFFKFMCKNHPEYKVYFVLSKKSVDYPRLSKIGKVLDNNSKKYKILFQISDYIVSSQAEEYITKVLGANNSYVQDKYAFKFVFLQHGIIKDDLSPWLNINTKRIDMFVTSSVQEYQSLLAYKYYYGENIVKLTGLPRYDSLIKKSKIIKPQKQIMISFTWRNTLASDIDKATGKRAYNADFKNSEYYKNINTLLNDEKILSALENYGYKIRFCPHPNVLPQLKDFKENKFVEIERKDINYQKEFCENSLMITDYSSVFFDFGYLRKPVIYFQYDKEEFFSGQLYNEGYFDYENMGFGPVCYNLNDLIENIINVIEKDCKNDDKYLNRIDNFFKFHDDKNCERVLNEIEKI